MEIKFDIFFEPSNVKKVFHTEIECECKWQKKLIDPCGLSKENILVLENMNKQKIVNYGFTSFSTCIFMAIY